MCPILSPAGAVGRFVRSWPVYPWAAHLLVAEINLRMWHVSCPKRNFCHMHEFGLEPHAAKLLALRSTAVLGRETAR